MELAASYIEKDLVLLCNLADMWQVKLLLTSISNLYVGFKINWQKHRMTGIKVEQRDVTTIV